MFMKRDFRRKMAARCGRLEHSAGRWLGLFIIVVIIALSQSWLKVAIVMSIVSLVTWITYLASHTIEKKLYGKHGPRG